MKKNSRFCWAAGVLTIASVSLAQEKPVIQVLSASYGLNTMHRAGGNATEYVKSACDGKRSCQISVKDLASKITDPSPGKAKDFQFVYRCGNHSKRGHFDADAADKTALLSCAD
jgi:hypothetical protein